jgi:hypothetical protein
MSGSHLVEFYGYSQGQKETDRVISRLVRSGAVEVAISQKEQRAAKVQRRSVSKTLIFGTTIGAVLGIAISMITKSYPVVATRFPISGPARIGLIVSMALCCGAAAVILTTDRPTTASPPQNEPADNDRYLVSVRCRVEDRLKILSLLLTQGLTVTDSPALE